MFRYNKHISQYSKLCSNIAQAKKLRDGYIDKLKKLYPKTLLSLETTIDFNSVDFKNTKNDGNLKQLNDDTFAALEEDRRVFYGNSDPDEEHCHRLMQKIMGMNYVIDRSIDLQKKILSQEKVETSEIDNISTEVEDEYPRVYETRTIKATSNAFKSTNNIVSALRSALNFYNKMTRYLKQSNEDDQSHEQNFDISASSTNTP